METGIDLRDFYGKVGILHFIVIMAYDGMSLDEREHGQIRESVDRCYSQMALGNLHVENAMVSYSSFDVPRCQQFSRFL